MEIPTPGQNELTKRLLAQGVKLDDASTWPEGVWQCDVNNFAYSREWKYTPTWESPCGLLIRRHGDFWGDTYVMGEFKCAENDNPLFGCPTLGKPCPHRLKLPAGINCQFHRTEREWREEESVERLERQRRERLRELWEDELRKYPGWTGVCANIREEDMPDGSVRRAAKYDPGKCIVARCQSTQCACRLGAARDITQVNVFYDLYIERRWTMGMVPCKDVKIRKGLKVFDRTVAKTDAEIALRIWRHDPDSPLVPSTMARKLMAGGNADNRETFFIRHHGRWEERENAGMIVEVRNIRIGKTEGRDLIRDMEDIRDGAEVVHDSDLKKAAEAEKSRRRRTAKVMKWAKLYAAEIERGNPAGSIVMIQLSNEKEDFREAVRQEAEKIAGKRRQQAERERHAGEQIGMFDIMDGGNG